MTGNRPPFPAPFPGRLATPILTALVAAVATSAAAPAIAQQVGTTYPVVDTGQDRCYSADFQSAGANLCPKPGQPGQVRTGYSAGTSPWWRWSKSDMQCM